MTPVPSRVNVAKMNDKPLIDWPDGWSENDAMNALQEHGAISDNCVQSSDIALADVSAALDWICAHRP